MGIHPVTFYCVVCGDAAATLSLSHEAPRRPAFAISGFMGISTEYLAEANFRALQTALQHQDSAAIYRLNSLWLPCYCPECQAHYCRQHWMLITQFDDDFPGWYDCTYGICPHQHKRLIDD